MIGISDVEYAALRFENFAAEVLTPALHPRRMPLPFSVAAPAAAPPPGPLDRAAVEALSFEPAEVGHRWGPVWSTAWFRIPIEVPADWSGEVVALRFSSGTEAMLRLEGRCVRALDANHDFVRLVEPAAGGERFDALVEAACNLPLGISTFFWDDPEVRRRWTEDRPGRVEFCELVSIDPAVERFLPRYELARQLAVELASEDLARAWELIEGLREITRALDPAAVAPGLAAVEPALEAVLRGRGARGVSRCSAIGHAHIDTAWLWPLRETRRKVARSWSNVMELMDRDPEFRFVASQPAQYAMLEEDAPELFERLAARVAEGRFEPQGGTWIEPDCTAPSGESLVRQILHGTRWFEERFGAAAPQRVLFLPDTFGFPASLPQIARLGGLDTFVTNKMSWCERNEFPFVSFRWRGLDGTELLSHFTPGHDYNAVLSPAELRRGERNLVRKDRTQIGRRSASPEDWLQPYGYGDGGGGPNEACVQRARLAADVEGLPAVRHRGMAEFAEGLHRDRTARLERDGRDLPVWDDELYLELHRGTATSQAWIKRANLAAERALRRIEALQVHAGEDSSESRRRRLDAAWKTVLLHQFHDILPGTSIAEVYEDARLAFDALEAELVELEREAARRAAERLAGPGPAVVLNAGSHDRDAVIEHGGEALLLRGLGPLELRRFDPSEPMLRLPDPGREARAEDGVLENEFLRVELDEAGRIGRLVDKLSGRVVNARRGEGFAPLNQLWLCDDRPRRWEAWDVDHDLMDRAEEIAGPVESRVVLAGPVRAAIELRRRVRSSEIVQRYVLDAHGRRLSVHTEVDWQERRTLLRTQWPVDVRAREATAGTQFGHLRRPSHRNTPRDEARFEFAAHRWVDLSERGFGVALWDDGKWGRSVDGDTLAMSLLRAPQFPDPESDRGKHRFCYGLIVHHGDPIAARVPALAEEAVDEPRTWAVAASPLRGEDAVRAPFRSPAISSGRVEIAALKPAERGPDRILRLVERGGGRCPVELRWPEAVAPPEVVDLHERSASEGGVAPALERFEHVEEGRLSRFVLAPFQIATLRIRPRA